MHVMDGPPLTILYGWHAQPIVQPVKCLCIQGHQSPLNPTPPPEAVCETGRSSFTDDGDDSRRDSRSRDCPSWILLRSRMNLPPTPTYCLSGYAPLLFLESKRNKTCMDTNTDKDTISKQESTTEEMLGILKILYAGKSSCPFLRYSCLLPPLS
ncbi:hypothetical protein GALMADRAFT_596350 [Galerina marginata CBS 339.88]|uniref:Uncharacterized protein n=1 Tax=Galerina marginata (strain CBS 339.88) TaxID=685588 RepID=A0A067SVC0_GALM3|nr:hypothetical protein GALMADRAFT_596350 [Galerina marginata CBS 339.88]